MEETTVMQRIENTFPHWKPEEKIVIAMIIQQEILNSLQGVNSGRFRSYKEMLNELTQKKQA